MANKQSITRLSRQKPISKKRSGPKRDSNGKFAPSSGGLLRSKKLSRKQMIPVILIVVLVGGFFVYKSFASARKPKFQYSVYSCREMTTNPSSSDRSCYDYSAEATTYRMYRAILKKDPTEASYEQWTQQMAGGDSNLEGRLTSEMLARRIHGMPNAQTGDGIMRNKAVVTNLYLNVYGNTNDKDGIEFWANQMRVKGWSVPKLLHEFVNNPGVISKLRPGFEQAVIAYKVPRTTIVAIARQKQEARTAEGRRINAVTKKMVDQMKEKSKDNNARKVAAGKIASKTADKISSGDLNTIKNNYINVIQARLEGFGGKDYKGLIQGNYTKVAALYDASKRVTSYSPDITNYGVTTEHKIANNYRSDLNRNYENAKWLLGETNKAYSIARQKYDAHQRWLKAKADCEAKGGTLNNGNCKIPQAVNPGGSGGGNGGGSGGGTGGGNGCPNGQPLNVNGTCGDTSARLFAVPGRSCQSGFGGYSGLMSIRYSYNGRSYRQQVTGMNCIKNGTVAGWNKNKVGSICPPGFNRTWVLSGVIPVGSGKNDAPDGYVCNSSSVKNISEGYN